MAKATNFRLSDDDRVILEALSSDWRMSQRAVISELLRKSDPRGGVHVEPNPGPQDLTDNIAVKPNFTRGSKFTPAETKAIIAKKSPPLVHNRILTREELEAKRDAFYRDNMAKGKK